MSVVLLVSHCRSNQVDGSVFRRPQGHAKRTYRKMYRELVEARAVCEAIIDFSETDDLEPDVHALGQ